MFGYACAYRKATYWFFPIAMARYFMKITLKNLHKNFDGNTVLKGVSLTLEPGQRWALIGPSAAGKTVLLKTLAGLYQPDDGKIFCGKDDFFALSAKARQVYLDDMGILFQQNALFDSLTNWENVVFRDLNAGKRSQTARHKAKDKATSLLAAMGLPKSVATLYPADLSGGMQKRVGLARAVASNPKFLLLDNPTAGLDPVLVNSIESLMTAYVQDNAATSLTITSEMDNLENRYSHVALLHQGRLQWAGSVMDIFQQNNPYILQMLSGSPDGPIRIAMKNPHGQAFFT